MPHFDHFPIAEQTVHLQADLVKEKRGPLPATG
jgi:hypothetical protein